MYGQPPTRNPMYGPTPDPSKWTEPPGKLPGWIRSKPFQVALVAVAIVLAVFLGRIAVSRWQGDQHPILIKDVVGEPGSKE